MARGRPPRCPHCKSLRTVSKGYRKTVQLAPGKIRLCKDCGRRFTVRR
jgi:transcription elongation factor Elf1